MTTPTQKGKFGDPTKDAARSKDAVVDVVVEVKLTGSRSAVAADYATIVGASYTAASVAISTH
jgi:hypothetical protein